MKTLQLGDHSELVGRWQAFLRGEGLYLGEIDDDYGPLTVEATRNYQIRSRGKLGPDGKAGNETLGYAMAEGFELIPSSSSDKEGPNWPVCPEDCRPASLKTRQELFGEFKYEPAGIPANPEAIKILGDWTSKNITKVKVPQLKKLPTAPREVLMHKAVVHQFMGLFSAWEREGLLHLVRTWAGMWVPRYVRGSRTYLSNHCLPATASVWTTQGPANIADLRGFDGHVWSFEDGKAVPGKVSSFFSNGRKPLLRVRAKGHELYCTPNHPLLVLRKETLPKELWVQHPTGRGQTRALYWTEMVRAEDLRKGDRIVALKEVPEAARELVFDVDWAEILGLFLGDGCIHHRQGKAEYISFCFPEGDRVRKHVKRLLTEYFGEPPKETSRSLVFYKQSVWGKFLPFDRPALEKKLPDEVWGWSVSAKVRLILGLLYSDGTLNSSPSSSGGLDSVRYRFKLGSLELVEGLKQLLSTLGFRTSRITVDEGGPRVIKGVQTTSNMRYVVSAVDVKGLLRPDADPLYLEHLATRTNPEKGTTPCWGYETVGPDFTHHPVQSIDYVGDTDVYDIEVEGHHNFMYDGVVVSNSWGTAFDINAPWNGLGRRPALVGRPGSVRELAPIAAEYGFWWGGFWGRDDGVSKISGRPDGMHFEATKIL